MVTIRAKIEGLSQLRSALGDARIDLDQGIDQAVEATGIELRADIIRRYNQGPASGRTYQKYKPRRTHKASAPGEAPMSDTGRLAGGTTYRKESDGVVVENRIRYARALEYGSRRIRPRPAWRPAAKKAEKALTRRIQAVIDRIVR